MRVLVDAGTGFIGRDVVQRLLYRGHEPVVLDGVSSGYGENLALGAAFFESDVRHREAVGDVEEGCGNYFDTGIALTARSGADEIGWRAGLAATTKATTERQCRQV